jgi:hypothetical protein
VKIVPMASAESALSTGDLAGVAARTLVMAGDDDAISAEHTLALDRGIPKSELAIVPVRSAGAFPAWHRVGEPSSAR